MDSLRSADHDYTYPYGRITRTIEQDKNSENAAVGYATVYPLSMFLRVLAAQLMILFFL